MKRVQLYQNWKKAVDAYDGDNLRTSIFTGAAEFVDRYIDRRQTEVVSNVIKPGGKDFILDVGCGAGRWSGFLCSRARRMVVGVDQSVDMLKAVKDRRKGKFSLVQGLGWKLPFKDSIFDVSFCCFSMCYAKKTEYFEKYATEIVRVTRDEGKVIIIDVTRNRTLNKKWVVFRTPEEYVAAFSKAGAKKESLRGYFFDQPIRLYYIIWRVILKPLWRRENPKLRTYNTTTLVGWLEVKGGALKTITEIPGRIILSAMHPIDRIFAGSILQAFCDEKVMCFKKKVI